MEWTMDYPVDFLCYTPEEFEEKRSEISIVRHAINEGIAIAQVGKPLYLQKVFYMQKI
jgi:hypothetical protein